MKCSIQGCPGQLETRRIRHFTLDYWMDDGWYVGKLREVPGVFSQGETFEELERNIKDAFALIMQESMPPPGQNFRSAELQMDVR